MPKNVRIVSKIKDTKPAATVRSFIIQNRLNSPMKSLALFLENDVETNVAAKMQNLAVRISPVSSVWAEDKTCLPACGLSRYL